MEIWTNYIRWIIVSIGVCVNLPQALKIYRQKSSKNVSALTYILLLIVVTGYLFEAIRIKAEAFMITNGIAIIVCLLVLYLIYRYRRK